MKLWIDDVRPAPEGYVWCKSVNDAKYMISKYSERVIGPCIRYDEIELLDIDHDAGDYASDGGDYIRILDWLEETGRNYPIHIHSQNPVGVENMRRIIERNGWKEVKSYDKLSPNAKLLALRKQKDELEAKIKELETQYTKCECGYLFDINEVDCDYEEYTRRKCFPSKCEFDDDEYGDVKYADIIFYCPVCGKKHIKNHIFIAIL